MSLRRGTPTTAAPPLSVEQPFRWAERTTKTIRWVYPSYVSGTAYRLMAPPPVAMQRLAEHEEQFRALIARQRRFNLGLAFLDLL